SLNDQHLRCGDAEYQNEHRQCCVRRTTGKEITEVMAQAPQPASGPSRSHRENGCVSAAVVCIVLVATHVTPAVASRAFDGTDAAVADEREFELELGPLQYSREGSVKSLFFPLVVNYGLGDDDEIVLEGNVVRRIGDIRADARTSLADGALSL